MTERLSQEKELEAQVKRDFSAYTPGKEEVKLGLFGEHKTKEGVYSRREKLKRLRQIVKVAKKYHLVSGLTPDQLVNMLQDLGPTFVKAGQILSMRSEILPQQFCKALERLRTDAEPMSFNLVKAVLEEEYGVPLDEVFSYLDPTPLGSASIAQVHKGRLVTGENVAVKVQRPKVREIMGQDIALLRSIARHVGPFVGAERVLDYDSVISELWESFKEETDFLVEAQNMRTFSANNADIAYVAAPRLFSKWTTQHVLVMDYIEGTSISNPAALKREGYSIEEIGTKLVENYTKQVLDDGFFHADPHPGNIIIANKKIVWIDWGMVGRVSPRYQRALATIMQAVATQDSPRLKTTLLDIAISVGPKDQIDHGALLSELDGIIETYGSVDLAELDLGEFLGALIAMAQRYGLQLPSDLTMIARGLITLEGVLDEFIPEVSMVEIIKAHLAEKTYSVSKLERELRQLGIDSEKALKGSLQGLSQAGVIADMLTRGQLKFNMDFVGSEDPIEDLSHIADRLALAIIVAGLLIGSAILYFAGSEFTIFGIPLLGFVGFMCAFGLSAYTAYDILHHKRQRNKK